MLSSVQESMVRTKTVGNLKPAVGVSSSSASSGVNPETSELHDVKSNFLYMSKEQVSLSFIFYFHYFGTLVDKKGE